MGRSGSPYRVLPGPGEHTQYRFPPPHEAAVGPLLRHPRPLSARVPACPDVHRAPSAPRELFVELHDESAARAPLHPALGSEVAINPPLVEAVHANMDSGAPCGGSTTQAVPVSWNSRRPLCMTAAARTHASYIVRILNYALVGLVAVHVLGTVGYHRMTEGRYSGLTVST